ncbi:MAG: hypothetical protein UY63_C0017G0004 [Parcubacteria group bacterium GW2011_GWA2_51_10]|nr:MAG: hypothetical protein UY63_C0017G0004 [Parcubacteria group bacterium GW2011_GWA2_51_10]
MRKADIANNMTRVDSNSTIIGPICYIFLTKAALYPKELGAGSPKCLE